MSKTQNSDNPYKKLEGLIAADCHDQKPHIFLHPDKYGDSAVSPGLRDYNDDELEALKERDFETRLFLTATPISGQSVWLRTRFSDNHIHNSIFNIIRDYFKAVHATKNFTAAKSILAEALTMCMEMDKCNYHSFAISVASGLSNMGENTSFQIDKAMVGDGEDIELARRKLCLIMHIIFDKIGTYEFLNGEGSNIYRMVHCNTTTTKEKGGLFIPYFSFLLQICLTVYVILENVTSFRDYFSDHEPEDALIGQSAPLAFLTLAYSGLVAYPGVIEIKDAFRVYGRIGPIQMLDFIVNSILPFVLLVAGFFAILFSDSFIDSVLNTAALLFIPEIDDQLPELLGYDVPTIVKNFVNHELMDDFDLICECSDEQIDDKMLMNVDSSIGVQFSDFYLTNWPEQGSNSDEGVHFKPYEVKKGKTIKGGIQMGNQITPTNIVTVNCLVKKIIWRYTTGYEATIKPRIGYLYLEMINGEHVEINMMTVNRNIGIDETPHTLEGVFVITTFQMSSAILRLRVCGSYSADDFVRAFEYYSLWTLSGKAKARLQKYQKQQNAKKGHYDNFTV